MNNYCRSNIKTQNESDDNSHVSHEENYRLLALIQIIPDCFSSL